MTINGLPGFKITTTLHQVDYAVYMLFGCHYQYEIALVAAHQRWASLAPTLEAAVRSFRERQRSPADLAVISIRRRMERTAGFGETG